MNYFGIRMLPRTFIKSFDKSVALTRPIGPLNPKVLKMGKKSYVDSFVRTIKNNSESFAERIHSLSAEGYESKTLKELFTPKFKPNRRFNEEGYPVTTLIDKKTGEPVEAYIMNSSAGDDKFFNILVDRDTNVVGRRSFSINRSLHQIEPSFMSAPGNDRYAGIGLRCHQLAVEEAMINGCDTVCLESLSKALAFHKKSLFVQVKEKKYTAEDFKDMVRSIAKRVNINEEYAIKYFPHKMEGDVVILRMDETTDNIAKLLGMQDAEIFMELSGERLKLWQDMAKSQPILLKESIYKP